MPVRTSAFALLLAAVLSSGSVAAQRGQPVPPPTGTGLLAGQVIEVGSNRGADGIQVILSEQPGGTQWRVNADSKGRFFFGRLPARTFAIQTVAENLGDTIASTSTGLGRLVTLAEGERVMDLRIGILRFGSASGTVRDDAGDPVVGMTVVAFQRAFAGGRFVYPISNRARTDDRGEYQLPLMPGDYLMCACEVDPLPLDGGLLTTLAAQPLNLMAAAHRAVTLGEAAVKLDDTLRTYAPAFHPAASSASRAERVSISSGEDKIAVDINVTAVRSARVSGQVVGATGPVLSSSIRLRPVDEAGMAVIPDAEPILTQADGRFSFTGVPPGEYMLTVTHIRRIGTPGPSGMALGLFGSRGYDFNAAAGDTPAVPGMNPEWAQTRVSVGDRDITGLVVTVQPSLSISGRIEFAGSAAPPTGDRLTRMAVLFERAYRAQGEQDFSARGASLSNDGTFTVTGISPGPYVLRSSGGAPWSTVTSVTIAGRDVTDLPIEVNSSGLRDLVVTYNDGPVSTVPGRLAGARTMTGADALMVVAFPADRALWSNSAGAARCFRAAGIDQKGEFRLPGLPPGDYYFAPVEDRFGIIWQDADNLSRLARSAAMVSVVPGINPVLEIRR